MTQEPRKMTDSIRREIKTYNITAIQYVRGKGSRFGGHEQRCLWDLCGKPMMQWPLEVALKSKYINKVVLTSEDLEILRVGEKIEGVTVIPRPLDDVFSIPRDWNSGIFQRQRPRSLFSADTFGDPGGISMGFRNTRYYTFWYLQEQESFVTDIEVIIPANEPLGTTESLDELIEAFFLDEEANRAYSIYSVMPNLHFISPVTNQLFPLVHQDGLDRQSYPFTLYRGGPFYIFGKPLKATFNSRDKIAYSIVPEEQGMDIHDKKSLRQAEFYLTDRLKEKNNVSTERP